MNKETEYWKSRCEAAELVLKQPPSKTPAEQKHFEWIRMKWKEIERTPIPKQPEQMEVGEMVSDGEIEQVACDEMQQDWSDLRFKTVYHDGFIDGAKRMRDRLNPTVNWDELRGEFEGLFSGEQHGVNAVIGDPDDVFDWFQKRLTGK